MAHHYCLIVVACAVASANLGDPVALGQQATFETLPPLDENYPEMTVAGVSRDGSVVAGGGEVAGWTSDKCHEGCYETTHARGAVWANGLLTQYYGIDEANDCCPEFEPPMQALVFALSPDGLIAAGHAVGWLSANRGPAVWFGSTDPVIIPRTEDMQNVYLTAVTDGGSVAAGDAWMFYYFRAVASIGGAELVQLTPDLPEGVQSWVEDISDDGQVIVGNAANYGYRWERQGEAWTSVPLTSGEDESWAVDVTGDGRTVLAVVAYADEFWPIVLFGDDGSIEAVPGSDHFQPYAISDDGSSILAAGSIDGGAGDELMVWRESTGWRSLTTLLTDAGATVPWTLRDRGDPAISGDGTTFVGQTDDDVAWKAYLPVGIADTDGDGLLDDWETNGIPYVDEETGEDRRYILDWNHDDISDANPQRIDIFVEIDAMDDPGLAPTEADLQRVKDAFARAPVQNPDGTTGVRLHLEFSDMETPVEFFAGGLGGGFFDGYKDLWFGTNETSSELSAKRKAYRYCVFGSTHSGGSSSGHAEVGGNDFIVTLGAWTPVGGTSEQKAGTFMHELGHTLGLRHSGPLSELSDEEVAGPDRHYNLKPNYYSIMNYLWQTPKGWHTPGSWPLSATGNGYSATALPALDESDLDEMAGIVPDTLSDVFPAPGFAVPHNVALAADPPIVRHAALAAGQAVDWNGSGGFDEHDPGDPIARDVNRVRSNWPSSVDTTLGGYADWPHLDYNFRDSPDYDDGEHSTVEDNEITAEEDAALDTVLPPACVGDVTLNGTTDFADLLEVLAHWGTCAEGIACVHDLDEDGSVGFGDLLVLLAAWGPCE